MSKTSPYGEIGVAGPACNYAHLATYNLPWAGTAQAAPNTNSGFYVVPNYSAIGVDALTKPHGMVGGCNGYFSLTSAYGKDAGACSTQYISRLCNQ